MKWQRKVQLVTGGLLGGWIAGCPAPQVPNPPVDARQFVQDLLDQTADDTEPVEIDNVDLTFPEDPNTFASIVS